MAVGIVDRLETIEVAEHHREAELPALCLLDGLLDPVLQQHAVGQLGQRVVQGGLHQLLVGLRQRIGEQAGAGTHLAIEHRGDQRDPQRGQCRHDHQHGQPFGIDALAVRRAAQRTLGEVGCGHAGVVHADDGQAHHQRGQAAQQERPALLQAQPEGDPQRRTGRADRDQDRGGKPQRVVVDARLHLQRGHAQVVHGGNAQPHQHRARAQSRPRQLCTRDQPQCIRRGAHRHRQRVQGDGQVIADRDRQVEGEHADEVHRPDAQAHRAGTTGQPPAGDPAAGTGQATGHVQRGVRGEDGDEQREHDKTLAVGAGH
ncbi:hypothetical protein D3C71_1363570 [compost metagenome]